MMDYIFANKTFESKKEMLDFVKANKDTLIAQKKLEIKHGADVPNIQVSVSKAEKAEVEKNEMTVKAIINTTNVIDSHGDLHVDGIWNKSVKENKRIFFLQEHKNDFDHIISHPQDVKAYVEETSFKDLGYALDGSTQALVFEAKVKKSVNERMFSLYKDGYVSNHSVGMRYIKVLLAVDTEDPDYTQEKGKLGQIQSFCC